MKKPSLGDATPAARWEGLVSSGRKKTQGGRLPQKNGLPKKKGRPIISRGLGGRGRKTAGQKEPVSLEKGRKSGDCAVAGRRPQVQEKEERGRKKGIGQTGGGGVASPCTEKRLHFNWETTTLPANIESPGDLGEGER